MTGNVPELNDPANSNSRINVYPSALVGSGEIMKSMVMNHQ